MAPKTYLCRHACVYRVFPGGGNLLKVVIIFPTTVGTEVTVASYNNLLTVDTIYCSLSLAISG